MNELHNAMKSCGLGYSGAQFSTDRVHRYALWRTWDNKLPSILFIGLNPSRGNEFFNDPALKRCIQFSKDCGYGRMFFGNLFSRVSPDPCVISHDIENAVTSDTDKWLDLMMGESKEVAAVWGSWKFTKHRKDHVLKLINQWFDAPSCFGKNSDGSPKHPLYLPKNSSLQLYQ